MMRHTTARRETGASWCLRRPLASRKVRSLTELLHNSKLYLFNPLIVISPERDDFGKTAGQSRTPSPLKDGQAGPDDKNSSFFHTSRDDDLLISCQNKLLEDNLLLLRSILTHTEEIDKGRLDALFAIFDQEELFSVLLRREVHKEANPNVIMRYQSPAQVVLQLVLRKQSLLFLQRPVKQVCKAVGKKGKSKHSSGSMPSPRGSPSHASKGDLEVLLLCQNLHVVTAAVQVILHPFEIPQIACRFSSIAFQIVRTHPSIDESVVHDETLNQYVSRWAVSTVVFLYMIVPAIISPVRVGLLKVREPQYNLMLANFENLLIINCEFILYKSAERKSPR